jgi:hypothetical protein
MKILCMLATVQKTYMKASYLLLTQNEVFDFVSVISMPLWKITPSKSQTPNPHLKMTSRTCILCNMCMMVMNFPWSCVAHHMTDLSKSPK